MEPRHRKAPATPPGVERLIQRLSVDASPTELALPAPQQEAFRDIAIRARRPAGATKPGMRGGPTEEPTGVIALFEGPNGGALTKAAAVLANELGREVYRVDLSHVVSKYIGETEKNLSLLFDAAERAGWVLFFDEADALFGKRTDVKDSHDRYANIDINYLLERLESFSGLTILATNRKGSLDEAFTRRIRHVVTFPGA